MYDVRSVLLFACKCLGFDDASFTSPPFLLHPCLLKGKNIFAAQDITVNTKQLYFNITTQLGRGGIESEVQPRQ